MSSSMNSYSTTSWSTSVSRWLAARFDALRLRSSSTLTFAPTPPEWLAFTSELPASALRWKRFAFALSAFAFLNMLVITSKRRSLVSSETSLTTCLNSDIVISTASSPVVSVDERE